MLNSQFWLPVLSVGLLGNMHTFTLTHIKHVHTLTHTHTHSNDVPTCNELAKQLEVLMTTLKNSQTELDQLTQSVSARMPSVELGHVHRFDLHTSISL